jgi:Sec-independent protein translocase protein TatA
MFGISVSWGEIFVVGAVGVALTGKKDLPGVCRLVGTQLGRLVGLLQGARVRADQFAQQNELRQLQNELRAGLRELDHVKMELAVAASSQGVIGRKLGAITPSANKIRNNQTQNRLTHPDPVAASASVSAGTSLASAPTIPSATATATTTVPSQPSTLHHSVFDFDVQIVDDVDDNDGQTTDIGAAPSLSSSSTSHKPMNLPPSVQTERAVMEEEWEKQGIGFRAIGEQSTMDSSNSYEYDELGYRRQQRPNFAIAADARTSAASIGTASFTGSELLERLERQCLIFDQYDRIVAEKDAAMDEQIRRQLQKQKQDTGLSPKR